MKGTSLMGGSYLGWTGKNLVKQSRWCIVLQETVQEESGMKNFAIGRWAGLRTTCGRMVLIGVALCGVVSLAATGVAGQDKDKSGVNVTVTGKDGSDIGGLMISEQ